jgi:hypothetical protein
VHNFHRNTRETTNMQGEKKKAAADPALNGHIRYPYKHLAQDEEKKKCR